MICFVGKQFVFDGIIAATGFVLFYPSIDMHKQKGLVSREFLDVFLSKNT